jgi:ribulose-phosphate 3-epimerase
MEKQTYISVSTDPVKSYQGIIEYTKSIQTIADMIHCDVMDGIFVSNKTFDHTLVSNINQNTSCILDVHLMTNEPYASLENYIKAGANILTVHYEAFSKHDDIVKAIDFIHANKTLAGLSIKPETEFKDVRLFCYNIDVLLIMSVEPGMSGQKFIPETLDKIKEIARFRDQNGLNFKIEVDGGVNESNAKSLINAGVDILVSGSCIFKAENREEMVKKLKNK